MLKSVFTKFLCGLVAFVSIAFCGCSNSISDKNDDLLTMFMLANSKSVQYGSLEVSTESASRALYISNIKYAKATVSGTDISTAITSDFVNVTSGTGSFSITNIPVGNNRIVTVQGYDENKNAISGAYVSNIVNITTGSNSCTVTKSTTALGKVFVKLLSLGVNLSTVDADTFSTYIDSSKSWSLIDSDQIASDYNSSSLSGKSASDYVVTTGTVSLTSTLTNAYTIQITDPSSGIFSMSSSVTTKTVTDAAPGTWCIYALNSSGEIVASNNNVKVVSGETTSITVTESTGGSGNLDGKTIVFVKADSAPTIWAWEDGDGGVALSEKLGESWPGNTMSDATTDYMASPSGWYMKDFSSSEPSGKTIKFKLNGSDPELTGEASTFWYDGSTSSTTNPSPIEDGTSVVTFSVTNPSTPDDYIIVHAKYQYVYYWTDTVTGTHNAMTAEDDGWYTYTIPLTSSNIIFENDNNFANKTGDLSRSEAGEWWYKDGNWTSYNPDDSVAPVLSAFTADKSGTVSGNVVLSISATDNLSLSKAVLTLDSSTTLATISLTGTSASTSYTWETAYIPNGSHTITCVVYDGGSNTSETKSLTFTTSNANLPPVAVISGAGTAAVSAEKTYKATDSYDQNGGTISAYEWTVTGATVTSGAGTNTIVVTMPSTEGVSVSIKLRVKDNDDEWSEYVTKSVTVRNQDSDWDFRDETIYFLMTTRFYDGDTGNNVYCWDEGGEYLPYGDGDCAWRGDFKGLIQKLDYIKALGFTSIWITPVVVNASGIDYHGYHAFDFSHVDPRYASGSAVYDASGDDISGDQAYQELIDAVHDKGMKIIQDIVLNHTGNWGEKNINHIFDKATSSVVDSNGYKRAPVMVANEDSPIMKRAAAYYGYDSYASAYAAAQNGVEHDSNPADYAVRLIALKNDEGDSDHFYHHEQMINWNSELTQLGSMAGDCVDLNTENPVVAKYLRDCYIKYINMGVDAFRIDTVKHISRLTFNKEFNEQFMAAGGDKFFMFGETCARYRGRWNEGVPALSPSFYTWKESSDFAWSTSDYTVNKASASSHFTTYASGFAHPAWADGIANHLLNGNNYHTPDYSMRSYLDQIDFPMHWAFASATDAFSTAVNTNDPDFNDATWNVVYVDSHDYAPDNAPESQRYAKTTEWPRNMNLMFTFRGIPCIYYGSEIEFKSGCPIDPANARCQLNLSGRAYFGDEIEGTVTASDFGEYTASGTVATTLSHPLAQHVRRLNKIRAAIPALRKGQYSTEGCSGSIAFKRRYTTSDLDSFVLVAIGGQATFTGIPSGNYVEVITGNTVSSSGSLTSDSIGQDNMRVYVLKTSSCEITGKIGEDGEYLK
ncbi:MAG: hypothetical protein K6F15_02175 [Treponema sp.]|nr:hypothetical protein [Treponema sp.]